MLTSLLNRIGLDRPELRAWAMYDWANSAFFTTVITAVFPDFFASVAAADLPPAVATARFSAATTISVAIVAVLGPVLGAVADRSAMKKRLLLMFAAIGIAAALAMPFIDSGEWRFALLLFIVGNIGVNGSLVFYDALLPHVARPDEIHRVSTAGYAMGYLGGGLLLAVNLAWIVSPATFALPDTRAAISLSFVSVAVWWAVFTIPLIGRVSEPPGAPDAGRGFFAPFVAALNTARDLWRLKPAFLMLVAFLLYNDGIQTIIRMASIYGAEIGIDRNTRIAAFVLVQFVGIPCSIAFGGLATRLGAKPALYLALVTYTATTILATFMRTGAHFVMLAILVGLVQGGAQALSRSLFGSMIPRQRSTEFFGFFSVFEKFAGVLGPALFWATIVATGSSRLSVLTAIAFFIAGGAVLAFVDPARGRRLARAAELHG